MCLKHVSGSCWLFVDVKVLSKFKYASAKQIMHRKDEAGIENNGRYGTILAGQCTFDLDLKKKHAIR